MVTHPSESLQKALEQSESKRMLPRLPAQLRFLKMEGIGEGGVESFWNLIHCPPGVQVLQSEQSLFCHLYKCDN